MQKNRKYSKWEPVDVIALTTIIGCIVLLGLKVDGVLPVLFMVSGYYYGKKSINYNVEAEEYEPIRENASKGD